MSDDYLSPGRVWVVRRRTGRQARVERLFTSDSGQPMVEYLVIDLSGGRLYFGWKNAEKAVIQRDLFRMHFVYYERWPENIKLDLEQATVLMEDAKHRVFDVMGDMSAEESIRLIDILVRTVRRHAAAQIRNDHDLGSFCDGGSSGFCCTDGPSTTASHIDENLTDDEIKYIQEGV